MKRIGILTVTYVNNFGSHLQSFALQQVLQSLGFETEIITPKGVSGDILRRRFRYLLSRWYDIGELKSYFNLVKVKVACVIDRNYANIRRQRADAFSNFVGHYACWLTKYVYIKIK